MKELYIELVQIAFCQQSVLESIFSVAETNIYNKKKHYIEFRVARKHEIKRASFANVQFI